MTIDTAIRDREGAARIRRARYAAHAVSLTGGAMVRRAYRQRSLVEVLLPDADKLWDATLRKIDALLDDECSSIEWRRPWPGATLQKHSIARTTRGVAHIADSLW